MKITSIGSFAYPDLFTVAGCHSRQTLDYNPFRNLIEVSEYKCSALELPRLNWSNTMSVTD